MYLNMCEYSERGYLRTATETYLKVLNENSLKDFLHSNHDCARAIMQHCGLGLAKSIVLLFISELICKYITYFDRVTSLA